MSARLLEQQWVAIVTAWGIDKTEGGYQFEDLEVNVAVEERFAIWAP
jgi:hypothetical protein